MRGLTEPLTDEDTHEIMAAFGACDNNPCNCKGDTN